MDALAGATGTWDVAPLSDLNTGMLVDPATGQYVGEPADIGTSAADAVTSAEKWVWVAAALVALVVLKEVLR